MRWLLQLLRGRRWAEAPDHESRSLLCRLAWHAWDYRTHWRIEVDDVSLGVARRVVVARERECRSCGRVESEVRLP